MSAEELVLRVLDQREEARDETASHESKKVGPIEEKERFRWLGNLERSRADIPEGVKVITVCDREGDRYALCAKAQSLQEPLLLWIVRNRMRVANERLLDEIRKKPCRGGFK